MRPKSSFSSRSPCLGHMACVAALLGAAACDHARSAPESPDAVAGAGAEAGGGTAGASAACQTPAAPNAWAAWVMPNPAASMLPNPVSYRLSSSGNQVTDDVSGLTWQRNVDAKTFGWDEAKTYCACLSIDGVAAWRLPSRIELATLVDWTTVSPSIDTSAFPATASENFWTSSPVGSDEGLVYLVYFDNGHTTYATTDYSYHTRCVRSSATAPAERYSLENGSVYDTQTKLTWQQAIPQALYAWTDADAYCKSLTLSGSGWRLPSIGELQTLVNETANPAIDLTAFPQTPSEYFWSSSAVADDASRAWTTFFTNGSTYSFPATATKNVRCVR